MINESNQMVYLKVKDHSVSKEEFELLYNVHFDMLETYPQPSSDSLGAYYVSEDYISHTDGKRNLFEKTYQFVKQLALKKKLRLIASFDSEEKRLLDVGCGTGDFLKIAQDSGWGGSGIEPDKKARAIANQKTKDVVFDSDQLSRFEPNTFDVITLWHVLEHLPNLETQIHTLQNILKPQGTLVVAVPNFNSFDANFYKEFWAAYDVPRHLWHFSRTSISKLMKSQGMTVVKTKPMLFDAYYVSLLSEKYKSGAMNPIKAFWIGWRSNLKAKRSGEYSSLIYVIQRDKNAF